MIRQHERLNRRSVIKGAAASGVTIAAGAVSYTHLTLPTIYSV